MDEYYNLNTCIFLDPEEQIEGGNGEEAGTLML